MIRMLSLFSGIGAFEKALTNSNIPFELVNYCEIDRYASKSYAAIHNVSETLNLTDVTKINTPSISNVDLITYGFPCQDISQAGKQKGFVDANGNRTRSGLFFEALRIIEDTKPKYAIAENVKALTSKKFKNEFETVLNSLDAAGYNNYYQVLNAKDYGIPQNRERVFIISIRKDIDTGVFNFPPKEPLNLRLRDILENDADKKYYLSDEQTNRIKATSYVTGQRRIQEKEWCDTLCARDWKDPKCVRVGNIYGDKYGTGYAGNVYDPDGLCPTINTMGGGNRQPLIMKEQKIQAVACAMRGRDDGRQHLEVSDREYSNAITTVQKDSLVMKKTSEQNNEQTEIKFENVNDFKVRKLTPKECWRLMGFSDEDFEKAKATGNSNTQLYKQAGNSIVVNCLMGIFKELFKK